MRRRPNMAPRGGRRGTQRTHSWFAWAPVASLVLLVIVAGVVAKIAVSTSKAINKTTFCESAGPTAVTTILIDATDSISPLQKLAVSNRLQVLLKQLRPNERVDVFSIRPDANPLKPEFSMCRPANADETSVWNANKNEADRR